MNGAHEDTTTSLGELIHDMRSKQAAEMLIPEFADRTRDLKEKQKGEKSDMGYLLDELVMEGRIEGRAEGKIEGRSEGRSQAFFDMVRQGIVSAKIASENLSMTEDVFNEKLAEYLRTQA